MRFATTWKHDVGKHERVRPIRLSIRQARVLKSEIRHRCSMLYFSMSFIFNKTDFPSAT